MLIGTALIFASKGTSESGIHRFHKIIGYNYDPDSDPYPTQSR